MKREFLLNIVFLLLVNLLIKPFYLFGIDRTVQNVLPLADYGIYFALFNFTFLFQIVTDFGIQNFNNRHLSQQPERLDEYLPNMLVLKGLLATVYFLLVLGVGWWLGYLRSHPWLLLTVAGNQVLASLLLYLRTNVSGLGLYRLDSLLSATDKLLLIFICGAMLWLPSLKQNFNILWFARAHTAALGVTAVVAFIIAFLRVEQWRLRWQPHFLWSLLRQSWPYALAVFLMAIYSRVDGVMIEQLLPNGAVEASLYASAYRLFEACNMIGFLFAGLLLPIFSRMLKVGEDISDLASFSFQMLGVGALTIICCCAPHRTAIMEALYTSGSAYSGRLLLYLLLSFFAVGSTYIVGTALVANDSLRQLNRVFTAGLLLNVLLNLWLIPQYKAEGAAIATCATQFGVLLAEIGLCRRLLGISLWSAGRRLVGFAGAALALAYGALAVPGLTWPIQWLGAISLCGTLALAARLVDLRLLLEWKS